MKKLLLCAFLAGCFFVSSMSHLPKDVKNKAYIEDVYINYPDEMISVLKEYLGESLYELALKRGQIVMQPIEYIRGQSFSNSFIIIDECQNLEIEEAKSIITRIGENSKIAFMGDTKQSDLKHNNGLNFLVDGIMNNKEIYSYSSVIDFTIDDVVRSDLCAAWVKYLYSESA